MLTPAEHLSAAAQSPLHAAGVSRGGELSGGASRISVGRHRASCISIARWRRCRCSGSATPTKRARSPTPRQPAAAGVSCRHPAIVCLGRSTRTSISSCFIATRNRVGLRTACSPSRSMHSCAPWVGGWTGGRMSSSAVRSLASSARHSRVPAATGMPRTAKPLDGAFTLLSAATVDRRRAADRDQLSLFPSVTAAEPGVARVSLAPQAPEQPRRRSRHLAQARRVFVAALAGGPSHLSPHCGPACRGRRWTMARLARHAGRVASSHAAVSRVTSCASSSQPVKCWSQAGIVHAAEETQDGRSWYMEYRWT